MPKQPESDTQRFTISESSRVKLKVSTMWGIVASIVGTTIWLTVLILRTYMTNQAEHLRLMDGLTRLNVLSQEWVTRESMVDASIWMAGELHATTNASYDFARERYLRTGMRRILRSPKDREANGIDPFAAY